MLRSELLEQLQQLSRLEKFKIIQFLVMELAKEEGLSWANDTEAIMTAVHTGNTGAAELMQLLEMEAEQVQNV
ncbi:hypothetical protein PN466_16265 [Roseofilum reptotaenium CS-1145]|uniref:Uncharacterized protein n=1 Tax=Roseofilum reptotaenium AO1-A TaxID=1925591 RepID=A0A1L9QWS3_9CYAN|nr:hypothetical protein [Roseofilum reptotaenium]MDB9518500.1 hypothetical protein [Roseofilum reptotaenium CS-1145]OJJ27089.1 hypothetical protein BI308_03310 [Roseofilum reptotaenium AO1-A]